jgi:antitoxin ParD1/3/4
MRHFVENAVKSGTYKTSSEVVRDGLRLLQEQHAKSKLTMLRKLISEGEESGKAVKWDLDKFLTKIEK